MRALKIKQRRSALFSLAICAAMTQTAAAASTTYVWTSGVTDNWSNSTTDWTPTGPASGAGNIATYTSTTANGTTNLDQSFTIGQLIASDSGRLWTIGNPGTATLTLDDTGGSNNSFGNAAAGIVVSTNVTGSVALQVNPNLVLSNTDPAAVSR